MINLNNIGEITNTNPIILDEKNSKIVFINARLLPVRKIKVDEQLKFSGKKCDFLLILESPAIEHYVELKSTNITEACKQIDNTLNNLFNKSRKFQRCAYIIYKNLLPKYGSVLHIFERKFKNKYQCYLLKSLKYFESDIQSCGK